VIDRDANMAAICDIHNASTFRMSKNGASSLAAKVALAVLAQE